MGFSIALFLILAGFSEVKARNIDLDSGHTAFAFSTATSLAIQYKRWYITAPAFLWAGGVAYSRIHLGAHYPSDVFAGALLGAASAYISYKGNLWLKGRWRERTLQTNY